MSQVKQMDDGYDYDCVVIGSGFGGSVSALRLSEKGYRVLVVEKGCWWRSEDFPRTNWSLRRWLWVPALKLRGIMRLSVFRHLSVLSGVGVGGGSLVYAATLPMPKAEFFKTGSWAGLQDWEQVLAPHYATAYRMLGAQVNPILGVGDEVLAQVAQEQGCVHAFEPAKVGVYFAAGHHQAGARVPDPFFGGEGPERASCVHCGACMTGCRVGAKNSLDKNYLYLAQHKGAQILAESLVYDVRPLAQHELAGDAQSGLEADVVAAVVADGSCGYELSVRSAMTWPWLPWGRRRSIRCRTVVFAAGALGTNKLLLQLKRGSMPQMSERVGCDVRSNNECLIAVTTPRTDRDFSRGLAIGSIVHTDAHSHLEPVRYGAGSGAWRLLMAPMVTGSTVWVRLARVLGLWLRHPWQYARIAWARDWAKQTQIMLFMQHLDSTLRFRLNRFGWLQTDLGVGVPPRPDVPQAMDWAQRYAQAIGGAPFTMVSEHVLHTASTAHLLGGAVMGADAQQGVVDACGRLFGYQGAYVCDGSVVSANPGVNPSLSITAIAEYVMAQVPQACVRKE